MRRRLTATLLAAVVPCLSLAAQRARRFFYVMKHGRLYDRGTLDEVCASVATALCSVVT